MHIFYFFNFLVLSLCACWRAFGEWWHNLMCACVFRWKWWTLGFSTFPVLLSEKKVIHCAVPLVCAFTLVMIFPLLVSFRILKEKIWESCTVLVLMLSREKIVFENWRTTFFVRNENPIFWSNIICEVSFLSFFLFFPFQPTSSILLIYMFRILTLKDGRLCLWEVVFFALESCFFAFLWGWGKYLKLRMSSEWLVLVLFRLTLQFSLMAPYYQMFLCLQ